AMALIAFAGVATVGLLVGSETLVQLGSDADNRGRVAALMGTGIALAELIGMSITGVLADRLGIVPLLDAAAAAMVLGGAVLLLTPKQLQGMSMSDAPSWRASASSAD